MIGHIGMLHNGMMHKELQLDLMDTYMPAVTTRIHSK